MAPLFISVFLSARYTAHMQHTALYRVKADVVFLQCLPHTGSTSAGLLLCILLGSIALRPGQLVQLQKPYQ
ncbi:putative replicase [Salmonella phage 8-19]|nr:putative replicase [Salmonella phage 8-19]